MKDIYFNNISKSFDEKPVLQDFCLTLPAGRRTCIMGPSGCGKTTLLNILCGLVKPDTGGIYNLGDAPKNRCANRSAWRILAQREGCSRACRFAHPPHPPMRVQVLL